ncbi:MAG: transglutaminase domain-containing protein [Clostridia bacterium]|nr:transglutaminase domain-containing protein [Clostridia bacterium]
MTIDERIKEYSGMELQNKLSPEGRAVFTTNLKYMRLAFGENVEYERLFHQTLLAPETEEYLYRAPAPTSYAWGSRPVLEAAVAAATGGAKTDTERAIALMCYIRDLKDKVGGIDYFYGGTEEELIKKGERFCERVARLMCGLCDIAGIPARVVFHLSGGHLTTEVYTDGKWRYIDPRFGLFYLDETGEHMSVLEIMRNPKVIFNQPQWVYDLGSKEYTPEFMAKENYEKYLRPGEIQLFGDYRLADAERYGYHYEWMPSARYPSPERDAAHREYVTALTAYIALTPAEKL